MKRSERLKLLQDLIKLAETDAYGGSSFELSPNHKAAIISKSGFSCAVCEYADIRDDGPHCTNEYWIKWNGGKSRLPVDDPKIYCSDWFQEK